MSKENLPFNNIILNGQVVSNEDILRAIQERNPIEVTTRLKMLEMECKELRKELEQKGR